MSRLNPMTFLSSLLFLFVSLNLHLPSPLLLLSFSTRCPLTKKTTSLAQTTNIPPTQPQKRPSASAPRRLPSLPSLPPPFDSLSPTLPSPFLPPTHRLPVDTKDRSLRQRPVKLSEERRSRQVRAFEAFVPSLHVSFNPPFFSTLTYLLLFSSSSFFDGSSTSRCTDHSSAATIVPRTAIPPGGVLPPSILEQGFNSVGEPRRPMNGFSELKFYLLRSELVYIPY